MHNHPQRASLEFPAQLKNRAMRLLQRNDNCPNLSIMLKSGADLDLSMES